tara:strand:- start:2645 stop:3757 length:1113 start_codon:yes stop_codon:yes gene_type:complete
MYTLNFNFKKFTYTKRNKTIEKKLKKKIYSYFDQKLIKSFSKNYKLSLEENKLYKYKKFKNYNIIGMGGSSLGAKAIYNFFKNKVKKNFSFIDNINLNENYKKKETLNIIISKSGNTIETIANFKKLKSKKNNLFICENSNNTLRTLAQKLKSEIINHKNYIGGRYSVLSEVGMLPATLMGLDARKFKHFDNLIQNKFFFNSLIENVGLTISLIKKKKFNSVILNYDESSEDLFKWYQQLIAESLGKKSRGIFPIVSNLPRDNHSLMQLYLDGPKKNFFTFFDVLDFSKKNSLAKIKLAQKKATQIVFKKKKIPFRCFDLLSRSEKSLGEIFTFFMLESILLGKALNLNPFDQPSVELIKIETNKIIKHS